MIKRQRAVMTAQHAPASWPQAAALGANQTASTNAQRASRGTSQARIARHAIEMAASYQVPNIRLATTAARAPRSSCGRPVPDAAVLMALPSRDQPRLVSKPLRAIERLSAFMIDA